MFLLPSSCSCSCWLYSRWVCGIPRYFRNEPIRRCKRELKSYPKISYERERVWVMSWELELG